MLPMLSLTSLADFYRRIHLQTALAGFTRWLLSPDLPAGCSRRTLPLAPDLLADCSRRIHSLSSLAIFSPNFSRRIASQDSLLAALVGFSRRILSPTAVA